MQSIIIISPLHLKHNSPFPDSFVAGKRGVWGRSLGEGSGDEPGEVGKTCTSSNLLCDQFLQLFGLVVVGFHL